MTETCERLAQVLAETPARLMKLPEDQVSACPARGRWCKKEILGHLIDSAANNHQRFVRGQLTGSLIALGYEQEGWVTAQGYGAEPWPDVVNLWLLYNRHLLHVLRRIPQTALGTPITVGNEPTMALSEIASSYVDHLQHHLRQILD